MDTSITAERSDWSVAGGPPANEIARSPALLPVESPAGEEVTSSSRLATVVVVVAGTVAKYTDCKHRRYQVITV